MGVSRFACRDLPGFVFVSGEYFGQTRVFLENSPQSHYTLASESHTNGKVDQSHHWGTDYWHGLYKEGAHQGASDSQTHTCCVLCRSVFTSAGLSFVEFGELLRNRKINEISLRFRSS